MKRNLAIGMGIAVLLIMAVLLAPYLLSLPLPGFMVRQLKQVITSSHEKNSSLDDVASSRAIIWEINRETLERFVVGRIPIESYELRYSPDRTRVVFVGLDTNDRNQAVYQYQVYAASIDGSNVRKLTHDSGPKHQPSFTLDGSEIIFLHEQGKRLAIKRMNSDGTNIRTVTQW